MALLSDANGENSGEAKKSIFQKFDPLLHGGYQSSSYEGSGNGILTLDFLKKYIYYAKTRYQPVLTDGAIELISEGYAELRSQQNARTLPVTARSLETLIRLASAHAKARLSKTVEAIDAEKAMALVSFALYHDATETHSSDAPVSTRPTETPEMPEMGSEKAMEEMAIEAPVTPTKPAAAEKSRKRDRTSWRCVNAIDIVTMLDCVLMPLYFVSMLQFCYAGGRRPRCVGRDGQRRQHGRGERQPQADGHPVAAERRSLQSGSCAAR